MQGRGNPKQDTRILNENRKRKYQTKMIDEDGQEKEQHEEGWSEGMKHHTAWGRFA